MKKFKRAGSVFLMAVMMGVLVFGCSSNEDEKRADAKDGAKTRGPGCRGGTNLQNYLLTGDQSGVFL